jgi:hypothetical protein
MLKYMVSSRLDAPGSDSDRPEQAVLDLLLESGLMSEAWVPLFVSRFARG